MGHSQIQGIRRLIAIVQADLVKFHLKQRRRGAGRVDDTIVAAWDRVEARFAQLCAAIDEDKAIAARVAAHGETYVREISKTNADNYQRRLTCVAAFLDGVKAELTSPDKAA